MFSAHSSPRAASGCRNRIGESCLSSLPTRIRACPTVRTTALQTSLVSDIAIPQLVASPPPFFVRLDWLANRTPPGTCFLSCTPGVPGLVTQYFQTSPHPVTAVPIDPHLTTPYRFPALSNHPPVAAAPSTHLLLDFDLRAVSTAQLGSFIAQLRMRAHPDAMIIVVARPATRAVVSALEGVQVVVVPEDAAETAYLRVLCPLLGRCRGETRGGGGAWGFGALVVGALAVWSSRGVVVGAVAAVCGRRRIGMETVMERDKRG